MEKRKPVMKVSFPIGKGIGSERNNKIIADKIKAAFGKKFDLVFVPDSVNVYVDNMISLNIGKDTDFEEMINAIDQFSKSQEVLK